MQQKQLTRKTMLLKNAGNVIQKYFLRSVHYVQGQSYGKNVREYFYYIDHQGQVSLKCTVFRIKKIGQKPKYFTFDPTVESYRQ